MGSHCGWGVWDRDSAGRTRTNYNGLHVSQRIHTVDGRVAFANRDSHSDERLGAPFMIDPKLSDVFAPGVRRLFRHMLAYAMVDSCKKTRTKFPAKSKNIASYKAAARSQAKLKQSTRDWIMSGSMESDENGFGFGWLWKWMMTLQFVNCSLGSFQNDMIEIWKKCDADAEYAESVTRTIGATIAGEEMIRKSAERRSDD